MLVPIVKEQALKIHMMLSLVKNVEVKEESQEEFNLEEDIITYTLKLVPDAREKEKSLVASVISAIHKRLFQVLNSLL